MPAVEESEGLLNELCFIGLALGVGLEQTR